MLINGLKHCKWSGILGYIVTLCLINKLERVWVKHFSESVKPSQQPTIERS